MCVAYLSYHVREVNWKDSFDIRNHQTVNTKIGYVKLDQVRLGEVKLGLVRLGKAMLS